MRSIEVYSLTSKTSNISSEDAVLCMYMLFLHTYIYKYNQSTKIKMILKQILQIELLFIMKNCRKFHGKLEFFHTMRMKVGTHSYVWKITHLVIITHFQI